MGEAHRHQRLTDALRGSSSGPAAAKGFVAQARQLKWCTTLLLLGLPMSSPHALELHYDDDRDAALVACDDLANAGERAVAVACFETLADHEDTLVQAEAAAALGDVRTANRLFRELSADRQAPRIKTRWAHVYLQTHQTSDAIALFREALLYDSDYLPARLGLAEAMGQSFEGRAREELLDITLNHPDNTRAHVLLAHIELQLQNIDTARGLLATARDLAREQDQSPLEILALQAAADLLEDKSIEPKAREVLAINPHYGDFYNTVAQFYIITYRYREAVALYQKAVSTDPQLAAARRDLGINLLRLNELFGARYHLQRAFELDPFDAQTVNTLRLIDSLDDMQVSAFDVPGEDDQGVPLGRVLLRLDREGAEALEPYVRDLSTRAMQLFSHRYDFELKQPMIVELYNDHDDFGVRTVSTPGIGLLGVTFGHLTAMDSPKARAAGQFHWGSTLWHEIAHVYTLTATNHRLPRWFSEGLSVYEEWTTGPLPDRELPPPVFEAMAGDRLLPIERLDQGFVRPTYPAQVNVSYMQAGLTCLFIAERHGHQALVKMLHAFADRASTAEALEIATGLKPRPFNTEFTEWLLTRYGELVDTFDDYRSIARQLDRAEQATDWVSVTALARDLIRRYPERVSSGNGYERLAMAQREQGDEAEALATLQEWHRRGGHEPGALRELAAGLRTAGDSAAAAAVLESLNWVMPYDPQVHGWLGEYYLEGGDAARARREYRALLGLQPDDPAEAWLGLARAESLDGTLGQARRHVLQSLESAPFYRPAQRLLLDLNDRDTND